MHQLRIPTVLQYLGNTDGITGSCDKLQQLQKYKREALEVTMITVVLVTMEIKYIAVLRYWYIMLCGLQIRLKVRCVGESEEMIKSLGKLEGRQQYSM